MTKEYIDEKIQRLKKERDTLGNSVQNIIEIMNTGIGRNGQMITRQEMRLLQRDLVADRRHIRAITSSINKLIQTTKKKGTFLPFSPYMTPTLYTTRKTLNERMHRGFRERAYKKHREDAFIYTDSDVSSAVNNEVRILNGQRHIGHAATEYKKWLAKNISPSNNNQTKTMKKKKKKKYA
jgi:hypothetical protein